MDIYNKYIKWIYILMDYYSAIKNEILPLEQNGWTYRLSY